MKTVLITGAKGFIGRNFAAWLRQRDDLRLLEYDVDNSESDLHSWAAAADAVVHLAGVNRPKNATEFEPGNAGSTELLCRALADADRAPPIILASSIQAELDNPYGVSKRNAEDVLRRFAATSGSPIAIFRLKNVFGKWCRPNYNSVVATFCHNIAHDLPIEIADPDRRLELIHVDDVVAAMLAELDQPQRRDTDLVPADAIPSHAISLGELAGRIRRFHAMRQSLLTPDFSERFNRQLYATYLSYVEPSHAGYGLEIKRDERGSLAEFIKSPYFGQIFVSRTAPGVTRGNHYHHAKTEKFLVLEGEGLIRMRHIENGRIHEFTVRGEDYRVVDILPGFAHSITNVGETELITLFWANEIFDPERTDTCWMRVDKAADNETKGPNIKRQSDAAERALIR